MSLRFKGIAHPPPGRGRRGNIADLNAAEIATTNMGRAGGTNLLMEHDHGSQIGTVHASWEGRDGSLRVQGVVHDPEAIAQVRSGATRGLSLGTSVLTRTDGGRLMAMQDELSLCEEPRRAGCWITDIDGASVRTVATFSGSSRAPPSPLTPHKTNLRTDQQCSTQQTVAMPETEAPSQQQADATPMDTSGVSTETYNASKKEAEDLRAQVAALKARVEVSDAQKREQLVEMKDGINDFFQKEVYNNSLNEPYKQQLAPVGEFLKKIDEGESIDTNLSIGRSYERIAATIKREREEFAQTKDSANLLAEANKKLDEVTGERDTKLQRIVELEGLVEERTKAAEAFQAELHKHGAIKEKIDFSNKAARENTGGAAAAIDSVIERKVDEASGSSGMSLDPHAALFAFMQGGPTNGGLKIHQSTTPHHFLGATSPSGTGADFQAAIRGY
tara:strand:- start:1443 stop:2780 length:1338 start_codon:yes stop_codon:yes gene_type:complete